MRMTNVERMRRPLASWGRSLGGGASGSLGSAELSGSARTRLGGEAVPRAVRACKLTRTAIPVSQDIFRGLRRKFEF